MKLDPRQSRITLLLFLTILILGQGWQYLNRPIYPAAEHIAENWPPEDHLLDATVIKGRALESFQPGTEVAQAIRSLGLEPNITGSGFCIPRAGILYGIGDQWLIRPMSQLERFVWRLPMQISNCTAEDLQRIKGVGPVLARKIHRFVQERGYLESLDELDDVPGVGPKKLATLKAELALW